jgi:hypothetical protein
VSVVDACFQQDFHIDECHKASFWDSATITLRFCMTRPTLHLDQRNAPNTVSGAASEKEKGRLPHHRAACNPELVI